MSAGLLLASMSGVGRKSVVFSGVARMICASMISARILVRGGPYGAFNVSELTVHGEAFSRLEGLAAHAGVEHLAVCSLVAAQRTSCPMLD